MRIAYHPNGATLSAYALAQWVSAALADMDAPGGVVIRVNDPGQRVEVLARGTLPEGVQGLALPADPAGYAHGLYAGLRELDARGARLLLAERPPEDAAWLALHDRLRRSAAGAGLPADDP